MPIVFIPPKTDPVVAEPPVQSKISPLWHKEVLSAGYIYREFTLPPSDLFDLSITNHLPAYEREFALINRSQYDVMVITNSVSRGLYLNLPIDSYGMNEQKVEIERRRCAARSTTPIFSANTHGWNEHYNTMEFTIVAADPEIYNNPRNPRPEYHKAEGYRGRIITFPMHITDPMPPRVPSQLYNKYFLTQIKHITNFTE